MNMVNKAFAEAAEHTAPEIAAHLAAVLWPVYGTASPQMVDSIADYMGARVPDPPIHRR